jgi:hypothetical protein
MDFIKEYYNSDGTRDAVLYEANVTECRGDFDQFQIVAIVNAKGGSGIHSRTIVRFKHEEFASICRQFLERPQIDAEERKGLRKAARFTRLIRMLKSVEDQCQLLSNRPST